MSAVMTATATTINGQIAPSAQIHTRPPVAITEGATIVAWARRSTEKNKISEAERYRGIVVQAASITPPADACASKFQRLLSATVAKLAEDQFTAWCKQDGNMMKAAYDGPAITVDSALMHWAEQKQRESIDGAAITAWLKQSATFAAFENDKQRAAWLTIMPKLAAPSYRQALKPDQAQTAILRIADADAEHAVCQFLMQRLSNIMTPAEDANADAL